MQDTFLEPLLGPSDVVPMREYFIDQAYEFGDLDDENTKFKSRVTPDYPGP